MKIRAVALLFALATSMAFAAEADERVTLDQVPPKVKETIQKHVQDGKVEEIERDREKGVVTYEVEYRAKDGTKYELRIAEDGKLLARKKD